MYANDMRQLVTYHRDHLGIKPELVLFRAGSCRPVSPKHMCMAWCRGLFLILNDDNICKIVKLSLLPVIARHFAYSARNGVARCPSISLTCG